MSASQDDVPSIHQFNLACRHDGHALADGPVKEQAHAQLAARGGCCSRPGCFSPVYVGSVCAWHSRHDDEEQEQD